MGNALKRHESERKLASLLSELPVKTVNATMLKLQWLAERLRKTERIKGQLEAGSYHVASEDVARAMLGKARD